jgi:hypothetical protein
LGIAKGVWVGTFEEERHEVRKLAISEAATLLEATLEKRIRIRSDAWKKAIDKAPIIRTEDRLVGWMLGVKVPTRGNRSVTPVAPLPAACERCGERLGWLKRSDARTCSSRCRQASYRRRIAA